MARTIFYLEDIDNTGTLYEEVISQLYPEELWNIMLTNTRVLRNHVLKMIKDFVEHEETIFLKEFSDAPVMIYDDATKFDFGIKEIETDLIIVKQAFNLPTVNAENANIDEKYALVLEALNPNNVTENGWDKFLDDLFLYYSGEGIRYPRVQKIMIEDVIQALKMWEDISNTPIKNMIKDYNVYQGITEYNVNTFWQEPLYKVSEKYWEKFSFVLTINDYDLYDEANQPYLDLIAEKYFNNGYFDEVVIKMNYLYWYDDYQKIVEWSEQNLRSALVSYRFDTLFSNGNKNRYFDNNQAALYNDIQRINTMEEELEMFSTRLPIFLEKILQNPQTYGFELIGGYFGQEGNIPNLALNYEDFQEYKPIICQLLATFPFGQINDTFKIVFRDPLKRVFICVRGQA